MSAVRILTGFLAGCVANCRGSQALSGYFLPRTPHRERGEEKKRRFREKLKMKRELPILRAARWVHLCSVVAAVMALAGGALDAQEEA